MSDELRVGVACGVCGSDEIQMQPCDECSYVQFSVCFGCGETYHLPGHHHERGCSKRPVSTTIVPLYDENLNPVTREDDE